MANYDFRTLSPLDLERLVRDALQKRLSIPLEAFKPGRDGGIDLRHRADKTGTLIVQCKHFVDSGYAKLLHHLKTKEAAKVLALKPSRYILATSVGLTPANKNELQALFAPYCRAPGDIYGQDDLNGILTDHPEVERSHLKLWLSSSIVLERLLHSHIYSQTSVALEELGARRLRYVQNSSFDAAMQSLDKHHVCIISGIPGIGKTTLAEMLVARHIGQNWEAFKLSNDVSEAFAVLRDTDPQVFYYDDFLGRTTLGEKLNKNEDDRLTELIEHCKRSKKHRFILTTREYILKQALTHYERLAHSRLEVHKFTIDLGAYTTQNRAEILFNHLYFSSVPRPHVDALLDHGWHKKIARHKNFSPRIVEWMTAHLDGIPAATYGQEFIKNLENPTRLWEHTFENQISTASQRLLLALLSMGGLALFNQCEDAFVALTKKDAKSFERALKELDGTFIKTTRQQDKTTLIDFHNPSIQDFLVAYLERGPSQLESLAASAVFFGQIETLVKLSSTSTALSGAIASHCQAWVQRATALFDSRSCQLINVQRNDGQMNLEATQESPCDRLSFLFETSEKLKCVEFAEAASRLAPAALKSTWTPRSDSVNRLLESCQVASQESAQQIRQIVAAAVLDRFSEYASGDRFADFCRVDHANPDIFGPVAQQNVCAALRDYMESEFENTLRMNDYDVGMDELAVVEESLEHFKLKDSYVWELEQAEEIVSQKAPEERDYDPDDEYGRRSGGDGRTDFVSDADLDSTFERLREKD